MATSRTQQPAWLLHATPYRETSLIVDLFTREHGRIAAVAKGAKRPRSALRAVLLQFQPLLVAYSGQRELRTLTGVEWTGGLAAPQGDALLCAFYLNELLMRLLAREDPHPPLFDAYAEALARLSGGAALDETLRRFEWQLLREIGYAPDLERDVAGRPIEAARRYRWSPGDGFGAEDGGGARAGAEAALTGATLADLAAGRFASAAGRQQAKYLTRAILSHHLDGAPLNTRQILIDLLKL